MASDPRYSYPPGATFRERAAVRAAYHRSRLKAAPKAPERVAAAPAVREARGMPQEPVVVNLPAVSIPGSRFWRSYIRLLDMQIFVLWLQMIPLVLGALLVVGVVAVIAWMLLFG